MDAPQPQEEGKQVPHFYWPLLLRTYEFTVTCCWTHLLVDCPSPYGNCPSSSPMCTHGIGCLSPMGMADESRTRLGFWEFVFSQNIRAAFLWQLKMSNSETSACRKLVFRKETKKAVTQDAMNCLCLQNLYTENSSPHPSKM